ncbi:hypothetical protein BC628DRAFT_1399331 [Trametes gibbosa]|nr:hypothetical protein BC628DRAFT_1399331 [Trametes gibbosa]
MSTVPLTDTRLEETSVLTLDDATVSINDNDCTPDVPPSLNKPTNTSTVIGTRPCSLSAHHPGPRALLPHIIVTYDDQVQQSSTAWGRTGTAKLGYHGFAKMVFDAFILHPARAPRWEFSVFKSSDRSIFWKSYKFLQADFIARVKMRPRFATDSSGMGGRDAISLQPVGWSEMVQNLVGIDIEYKVPEDYPGREKLLNILQRSATNK